jgi:hypothetical protein
VTRSGPAVAVGVDREPDLREVAGARARAHPKLNPQLERREDEKFDIGTAAHAIILEGFAAVEVIDAPDWRTKAAQKRATTRAPPGRSRCSRMCSPTSKRWSPRENVPLLLGVAGGTGSGKTYSRAPLARGIADGEPFAIVDTENGRAKHYADLFPEMRHGEIHAPFRPDKYADAIQAGAAEFPVVVVDSMSHEWAGDGGCLDWHDEIMGGDQKKNLSAWIEPKRAHKRMVTRLLQVNAHVILCFRAEPKVEAKGENGQTRSCRRRR